MRPAWSRPLQAWDIVSSSEEHFLHAILLGAAVSSAELSPHSSAQMAESFSPQSAIPRSDRTICTPGCSAIDARCILRSVMLNLGV